MRQDQRSIDAVAVGFSGCKVAIVLKDSNESNTLNDSMIQDTTDWYIHTNDVWNESQMLIIICSIFSLY